MFTLTESDAILMVRRNFDELSENSSDMEGVDVDSSEFERTIRMTLPEAINDTHLSVPIEILDGKHLDEEELQDVSIGSDGVLSFGTKREVLRLVAFKASDSSVVLTSSIPEHTAIGRMQLNPYTKGTSDNPRLVQLQGKKENKLTSYNYYALDNSYEPASKAIARFEYIPRYRYDESGSGSYDVAESVVDMVISILTGKLLIIYGESDKAKMYLPQTGKQ